MNKLHNVGVKNEDFKLGRITIIGGENEELTKLAQDSWISVLPNNTKSKKEIETFERIISEVSTEELKIVERKLRKEESAFNKAKRNLRSSHNYYEVTPEDLKVYFSFDEQTKGKQNCLSFVISRRNMPMSRKKTSYEVKKGDKLKELKTIREEDEKALKFSRKAFNRYKGQMRTNVFRKEGELKDEDLTALYFSKRIGIAKGKKFVPLADEFGNANHHIPSAIRLKMESETVFIEIRNEFYKISELKRKVFETWKEQDEAVSFLLNLKGESVKVTEASYYDNEGDELHPDGRWVPLKALSYNPLDYEKNHIVVIAKEKTLEHLENRVKKLHKEYYYFEDKNGDLVHGPYNLNDFDKKVLKNSQKEKRSFDESEIDELFDIFKERRADNKLVINGAQSIRSIEHDIRNHVNARYILHKSSDELFFLKTALEDAKIIYEELLEGDDLNEYLEAKESSQKEVKYIVKKYEKLTMKKITALINVVSGLHLRYEDEEDFGKYLSQELNDIDEESKKRTSDSNYKKHRNYYSQKEGVLAPYGNPQTTHKRRRNPPKMDIIRNMRKRNRNVIRGKYSGVSDPEILSEIYDGVMVERPSPQVPLDTYPRKVQEALGVKGFLQPRDVIDMTFEEIKHFLSSEIREEYWENKKEKVKGPQFRVPTKKKEGKSLCDLCQKRYECFLEALKRRRDNLSSPTPIDWIRSDFGPNKNRTAYKAVTIKKSPSAKILELNSYLLREGEIVSTVLETMEEISGHLSKEQEEVYRKECEERDKTFLYDGVPNWFFKENLFGPIRVIKRAVNPAPKIIPYQCWKGKDLYIKYKIEYPDHKAFWKNNGNSTNEIEIPSDERIFSLNNNVPSDKTLEEMVEKIIRMYSPGGEKEIIEEYLGVSQEKITLDTSQDKITKISNDMYKVTKNGFTFFAKGNIAALTEYPSVSIAGIRNPSEQTKEFVKKVATELSEEYVIISGLAPGCDRIAHKTCLDNSGITIAVLPSGFNNPTNKKLADRILKENGLLISEYSPETKANKGRFLQRNRIIAGLSNTVIICEAGNGTKNTFSNARRMKKNILAQRIDTFNNNSFFELGARMYNKEWVE